MLFSFVFALFCTGEFAVTVTQRENYTLIEVGEIPFQRYHEGWVYLAGAGSLYRMRPGGEELQRISDEFVSMMDSVYHEGWLYFTNSAFGMNGEPRGTLSRMRLDGADKTTYEQAAGTIGVFAVQGDWIYALTNARHVYRIKTDGSERHLLARDVNSFLLAGQWLFTTEGPRGVNSGAIVRYDLNGAGRTVLLEENYFLWLHFADDEYLYYAAPVLYWEEERPYYTSANMLQRMRFDGSGSAVVIRNEERPSISNMMLHGGHIYFLRAIGGGGNPVLTSLFRIRAGGTGLEELRGDFPGSFEIMGGHIYYVRSVHDMPMSDPNRFVKTYLHRLSLDGTTDEVIYQNYDSNGHVIYWGSFVHAEGLYVVAARAYYPSGGVLSCLRQKLSCLSAWWPFP